MTDSLVAVPSAEEVEQYGVSSAAGAGYGGIPLIADEEAVCRVRVLETGSGAYWARGDVDTHVLYAKEHGLLDTWLVPREAWLAQALRERREQRRRLMMHGVQTTAGGLMVLRTQRQLVLPGRS